MNRRQFVTSVSIGAAAAYAGLARPLEAAASGRLNVRFVGMMGFIEREDRSFLVATPGQQAMHHMVHTPFLMARAGSPVAKAFGLAPAQGVIPAAFDTALNGSRPDEFVYRSLDNTALEIVASATDSVVNDASQLAQMNKIAPGKRVRGNIEKWALATVSLRGGRLQNSAAHPDAGKVWQFGDYRQPLTDAVNFQNVAGSATTLRLTSGTEAHSLTIKAGESADLWVFSAAIPGSSAGDPTTIEHSEVLFDFLVDAKPVNAYCPDAIGRDVPPTEFPYVRPTSASMGFVAGEGRMPGISELCWMGAFLIGKPKG